MHSPKFGGSTPGLFPAQFPTERIDSTSLAVTPIELLANDGSEKIMGHATGFFWEKESKKFLVTAWHVVTGRDPFTEIVLSKDGYIPQRIRFYICLNENNSIQRVPIEYDLQSGGSRRWLEDVRFPLLRTDIAVIPLDGISEGSKAFCIASSPNSPKMVTVVGFDLAVLGYPTTNYEGLLTPIWRRASLASEPLLPIDNKPMFLVDGSTSPGFSGAPVLRRQIGPLPLRESDGNITIKADSVLDTSLIGVYAGRLQHLHFGGEVAYAFYANRLPLIVDQKP